MGKPSSCRNGNVAAAVVLFVLAAWTAPSSAEVAPGRWNATGALTQGRERHAAVRLQDGTVLVTGGETGSAVLESAELYRPDKRTWKVLAASMVTARSRHTATLLSDGRVLVVGGRDATGPIASAEVYDHVTRTWSSAGTLTTGPRYWHTATLLGNGKVLVAGGLTGKEAPAFEGEVVSLNTAEIWDPSTGLFTATGPLNEARDSHTATVLADGKVLAAGGAGLDSAEIYDPAVGIWSSTGSMAARHARHGATLLPDGTVLVAGGAGAQWAHALAERFNPATGTWAGTAGRMAGARHGWPSVVLLKGDACVTASPPSWCGKVLVAGGTTAYDALGTAELYDPGSDTWAATGSLGTARHSHTTTFLKNGKVLVVGGSAAAGSGGAGLLSAEIFSPKV